MYLLFLQLGDNVLGLNCRFNQQSYEKAYVEISYIVKGSIKSSFNKKRSFATLRMTIYKITC